MESVFIGDIACRKSGVITGVLLSIARISGETAPLLFTALNNQFFNSDMSKPMANLPVVIFQFAMSPYENWIRLAWGRFVDHPGGSDPEYSGPCVFQGQAVGLIRMLLAITLSLICSSRKRHA